MDNLRQPRNQVKIGQPSLEQQHSPNLSPTVAVNVSSLIISHHSVNDMSHMSVKKKIHD